jgi:heme-degrading monooxygenase HmoA
MAEIQEGNRIVTQITTVKLTPDKQDEVLNLMTERARFMATQPGFVSIALHRSKDASHVVNYVQWRDADSLAAAHHSPEFRKKWPQFEKAEAAGGGRPVGGYGSATNGMIRGVANQRALKSAISRVAEYPRL